MGFKHRAYLSGNRVYACCICHTHLTTIESMISRRFNGQHGQAYLFDSVFNTEEGDAEDRHMTTGLHRVRDVKCAKCGQTLGWKYERAYEPSQRYKEGKTILERALLTESVPAAPTKDNGEVLVFSDSGVDEDGSVRASTPSSGDGGSIGSASSTSTGAYSGVSSSTGTGGRARPVISLPANPASGVMSMIAGTTRSLMAGSTAAQGFGSSARSTRDDSEE